ncbi:MAG: hypothetical protein DHS20C18_24780 [Saprospiraceae bacterium]|nr:MAG: hypothetical protein DHS20C18_24780 [Saprospiraceae bacterium]
MGAKKFIFEVRDLWPLTPINLMGYSKNNFVIRIIDWFETYAYRKADAIVSLLQEAEKYINFKSRDSSKFFYIPNGIDSNLIQNRLEIKREDLNIPTDHLIIGYAGTIGFANAMDSFFELIAESEDLRSKVFFVIIGDGYLKNQYQANVSSCNNVLFLPKVKKTEIGSYIDLFDVCFIAWHDSPLYNYGVSANKYFDYMAGAKPILAAQSGINDPVIKAKNGVIVKNTKKEIYYGVKQFLEMNDSKRRELGKRGFDYLLENHVYSKLGAEYIRIINK